MAGVGWNAATGLIPSNFMAYPLSRNILGPLLKRRLVVIEGLEYIPDSGSFLIVANHVGYQDPILMVTAIALHTHRKIHAIAKWKTLRIPILKRWIGTIPLSRDRSKTIDAALRQLDLGEIVLIYPEGTVNFSDKIIDTKTGAARLAILSGCTVIPAGIRRVSSAPATSFKKYSEILTGRMQLYFGKPMYFVKQQTAELGKNYIHNVHNQIMREVARLAKKEFIPCQL